MTTKKPGIDNPSRLVYDVLRAWGSRPELRIWRANTGAGYPPGSRRLVYFGLPGTPDIIGILKGGRWLGIECKTGGAILNTDQRVFKKMIEELGGLYILARSVEDVDRALAGVGLTKGAGA